MDDIVAFLRARLDEDEEAARLARQDGERWRAEQKNKTLVIDTGPESMGWSFGGGSGVWTCDDYLDDCDAYCSWASWESDHITRHDPARVLAEVEAKRRIVADFEEYHRDYHAAPSLVGEGRRFAALVAVGQLAAVYDQHPDYDEAWRP